MAFNGLGKCDWRDKDASGKLSKVNQIGGGGIGEAVVEVVVLVGKEKEWYWSNLGVDRVLYFWVDWAWITWAGKWFGFILVLVE